MIYGDLYKHQNVAHMNGSALVRPMPSVPTVTAVALCRGGEKSALLNLFQAEVFGGRSFHL